jgi:PAS domain S-box-containing protein
MAITELFTRMKTLLAFVDSGILIADANYNIVYANPAAQQLFFKQVKDIMGLPVSKIFSKENWEKISESIVRVKQTHTPIRMQIEEKEKFFRLGISPIMDEEKYIGFILNMLDTTVEEHLLIQRSELTSMMINELKDPIYTLYDLFHTRHIFNAEANYIQQARDSTKMLMNALETLLEINQLTSGVLNLELDDADITMVIKSCVKSIEPFAQKHGVFLYTRYIPDNLTVRLDREKFTKGLINLLSLAIKEGHEKDVLYIETKHDTMEGKPVFRLIIANSGMGVAQSIFDNINEKQPFSHLKDEEKLYIEVLTAKRIIQAHSGQLDVVSEFGIGSSFVATLPVAS